MNDYKEQMLADIKTKAHSYDDGYGGVTDQVVKLEDVNKILATLPSEEEISRKWWEKYAEDLRTSISGDILPFDKWLDKEGEK